MVQIQRKYISTYHPLRAQPSLFIASSGKRHCIRSLLRILRDKEKRGCVSEKRHKKAGRFPHFKLGRPVSEGSGTLHKFARGGISAATVTLVLTTDSAEAEPAKLIAIILNVAAAMHHIFCCIHSIRSIERLIKDWSMSYRQIETTKKTGVTNDWVTREITFFALLHI